MANPTCAYCGTEAAMVDAVLERPGAEENAIAVEVVCPNPDCPGPGPDMVTTPKD